MANKLLSRKRLQALGIGKYLLVGAVVVFISFLFPNNIKFKYDYERGQRWSYEDLKAPIDFPIKKTDEEVKLAMEELDRNFAPFYVLHPEVFDRKQEEFTDLFNRELAKPFTDSLHQHALNNPANYIDYGLGLLKRIYQRGIITLDAQHVDASPDFQVNVFYLNTAEKKRIRDLFNQQRVVEVIIDSLPQSGLLNYRILMTPLQEAIQPNLIYNDSITRSWYEKTRENEISYFRGMVRKDTIIVRRGDIITDDTYQKLLSLEEAYVEQVSKNKNANWIFFGYFLLTSLILGVFVGFLRSHARYVFDSYRQLAFMLLWIVAYSAIVYWVVANEILSLYILPFCIVPIVIKNFYNARLALFAHIVIILVASFLSPLGYEFTFIQILAGIMAVLANVRTRYMSAFFLSMFYIWLVYNSAYLGLSFIKEGSIRDLEWNVHAWLSLNVFLTLLAYPLIPLLERVFGFISEITLMELTDLDKPLLRELSIKAPGTLQHSLQVANLSEAAAKAIGANALLIKVGALYHDIGKMKMPKYYIENQNDEDPHRELSKLESARIIIEHVTEGVAMARRYNLPQIVVDFIQTHHGTTRVEYFYRTYMAENPDIEVDAQLFTYPGPKPQTREESMLMIADSAEAASKSLNNPTEEDINNLVDNIVAGKISSGQFSNSALTFKELEICKDVIKKLLKSIYHVRIKYPEEQKK